MIAFNMLYGTTPGTKSTEKEKQESVEKEMVGVIPLGIPMLAGPGAISTFNCESHKASCLFE